MTDRRTLISFLLDRSGSMSSIVDATIDGFNEFVNGQKVSKVDGDFTLTIFDTESIDKLYTHPVSAVPELTHKTYVPRGGTPLLDAIGKTIHDTQAQVDKQTDPLVIFVIMTDGQENSSHEYKLSTIRELIKDKEDAGWQFVFLGANMDAYSEGMNLGMANAQYVTYSADAASVNTSMNYLGNIVAASIDSGGTSWTAAKVDTRTDIETNSTDVKVEKLTDSRSEARRKSVQDPKSTYVSKR